MTKIEDVHHALETQHPKLVFLSGKTSTGKTTLSTALKQKYNCAIIELDEVVRKLECPEGLNRFIEAYQKRDDIAFTNSFVEAVQQKIRSALDNHSFVVIEGAIVNTETLNEIISEWRDTFLFIYLDIKNIDLYVQRLTSRFVLSAQDNGNGLPDTFWQKFSSEILASYYENRQLTHAIESAIKSYATDSFQASEARLANFSSEFNHILKVEV